MGAVKTAVAMLQEVGAFDSQERLTPLGMHLTRLPMDVRLGRILIMGATLGCLGPTLTIVASMSSGAPWFVPSDFGERDMANKAKVSLLRGGKGTSGAIAPSDHLAIMRAYERWAKAKEDGGGTRAQRAVCDELYLSHYKMMNIQKQRRDLARDLRSIGFDARGEGLEVNSSGSGCVVYEVPTKCLRSASLDAPATREPSPRALSPFNALVALSSPPYWLAQLCPHRQGSDLRRTLRKRSRRPIPGAQVRRGDCRDSGEGPRIARAALLRVGRARRHESHSLDERQREAKRNDDEDGVLQVRQKGALFPRLPVESSASGAAQGACVYPPLLCALHRSGVLLSVARLHDQD